MDGIVSTVCAQDAKLLPYCLRNDLRRGITDRQRLPHGFQNGCVGKSRRQRINRQHPAGGYRLGVQRFKNRVRHAVADEITGNRPVENVFPSVLQLLGHILIIKESQIQPTRGIRHLHAGNIQTHADVGSSGCVHHHRLETGRYIRFQLFDGAQFRAIFIATGEMTDQIAQCKDIQRGKLFCLGRTDALEHGNRIG